MSKKPIRFLFVPIDDVSKRHLTLTKYCSH